MYTRSCQTAARPSRWSAACLVTGPSGVPAPAPSAQPGSADRAHAHQERDHRRLRMSPECVVAVARVHAARPPLLRAASCGRHSLPTRLHGSGLGPRPRCRQAPPPESGTFYHRHGTPPIPREGPSCIAELAIYADAGLHNAIAPVCLSFIPSLAAPKRSRGVDARRETRLSL